MNEQPPRAPGLLIPVVLKITGQRGESEVPGWIVPETDGTLAIDQRAEADLENGEPAWWMVTHVPTGFAVRKSFYTDASTREEAIAVAQAFYREAKARNFPLTGADPQGIATAHNAMTKDERQAFWTAIALAKNL